MALDQVELVRLYVDDPKDGTEQFDDDQIQSILTDQSDDAHSTAAKIWSIKAASVSQWYASAIDGSFLSRQQVWEHCMAMAKYHEDHSGKELVSVAMDTSTSADVKETSEF
jgi:hypothetical protein